MRLRTKKYEEWVTESFEGSEARFLVSPMTPKEDFELIEKCRRKEWDRNQRFETTDFYQFKISKITQVIKDWDGIEDENGNPIECSRYNKELVYLHNPDLIDRVVEKADKIARLRAQEEEEREKNLEAGPSGPAKKEK